LGRNRCEEYRRLSPRRQSWRVRWPSRKLRTPPMSATTRRFTYRPRRHECKRLIVTAAPAVWDAALAFSGATGGTDGAATPVDLHRYPRRRRRQNHFVHRRFISQPPNVAECCPSLGEPLCHSGITMPTDSKMIATPSWRDPLSLCFETHRRFLSLQLRRRQRALARRQARQATQAMRYTRPGPGLISARSHRALR
jgi:hypothetical protein